MKANLFGVSLRVGGLVVLAAQALLGGCGSGSSSDQAGHPGIQRILVTNDNGIDDTAIVELARALAQTGEFQVVVVASQQDRSGASNYMSATRSGRFRVERRDLGPGIEAYALDGQPADCVIFALAGPMREQPPDLVVSGINGGPNLGDDWFGSGTIGAARTAAYFGFPAIAVSGVEDDDPAAVSAAAAWVSDLVRSELVRELRAPEYLTVSLPVGPPGAIRGVRLVERARGLIRGRAERQEPAAAEKEELWRLEIELDPSQAGPDSDVRVVREGYIAIAAMRADESDPALAARLTRLESEIPPWPVQESDSEAGALDPCHASLGIAFDDAEDESGREWGVLIEEVQDAGVAALAGLKVGDVLTRFNGVDLASPPGSPEDPDDRFVALYRQLACGESFELEVVRDGQKLALTLKVGG